MKRKETRERFEARAAEIARKFFTAIYKESYREPSFFALMMFKIQQMRWKAKGVPGTVDYQYWEGQGWLDARRTFYIAHDAGW